MADDHDKHDEESTTATATAEDEKEFKFVEEPTFDVQYKGQCAYEVKVSISPVNQSKQAEEMFEELRDGAEMPGFRKGRAPRKLIEKKFGKHVKNDVEIKLVGAAFQKLIKDKDLKPLGMPDIDGLEELKDREDSAPLEVTFKFEVSPRVELGKYRGIEVERPVVKVDDSDVTEHIEEMRGRFAIFEDLEGGVAAEGDQTIIDFKGAIDGKEFSGNSAENYPYILGSGRFLPEFEKALLGASAGDNLNAKVKFPDDYHAEELRGKTGEFEIKVNEIKRKNLPAIDDDLAALAGHKDLASMQDALKKQLTDASVAQSERITQARALAAVVDGCTFEIPETVIGKIAEDYLENEIKHMMSHRVPKSAIDEQMETLTKNARENALNDIRTLTVLNEIGEAEGVEVTEADFEKEAESMAGRYGLPAETVAQYIAQSDERDSYESRIYRTKALAVIMDNAKITDKELPREELDKEEGHKHEHGE